jgi:hypothetical protein
MKRAMMGRKGVKGVTNITLRRHTPQNSEEMVVVRGQEGMMLDSLPVRESRIGVESGKNSGSIGDIWPGGECQVHQRANNGDVGVLVHFCNFCTVLWGHGGGKARSRVKRSGHRLAIL